MDTSDSDNHPAAQRANRVVLFGVDGMRPDALALLNPPEIMRLISAGAYCDHAQSVNPPISLPCWLSAMTGTLPQQHGTLTNVWKPPASGELVPALLDVAHQAGLRTASFYNWEPIREVARPGSLDRSFFCHMGNPEGDADLEVAEVAAESMAAHCPDIAFVYFGAVDEVGHLHGWMSRPYLEAIRKADRAIGLVLTALEAAGLVESTAFLVMADHGGEGHNHADGTKVPTVMTVPWVGSGAGFRRGHKISEQVSLVDTAPTAAHLLGLTQPAAWTGRVVTEALVP